MPITESPSPSVTSMPTALEGSVAPFFLSHVNMLHGCHSTVIICTSTLPGVLATGDRCIVSVTVHLHTPRVGEQYAVWGRFGAFGCSCACDQGAQRRRWGSALVRGRMHPCRSRSRCVAPQMRPGSPSHPPARPVPVPCPLELRQWYLSYMETP